jgi:phage terminase large subunit-like protein
VDDGVRYADDVLSGRIPACLLVQEAAQRFQDDLAGSLLPGAPWVFRPDLAEPVMRFSQLLQNVKGPDGGKPLRLAPWQKFIIMNLYGWVESGSDTRRFRQAVIFVPRGNGKTTMCAPLMLRAAFLEGEAGSETYAASTSRDQSRILWDTTAQMLQRSPELAKSAGIKVGAHAIFQVKTGSKCVPVSSDAKSLEGLSVHLAVLDEVASHISDAVYSVMLTACGKRKHPLILSISTATGNTAGIGKQLWDYATRVLNRTQDDDRLFALIYTADTDDDPWAESTWIKCNPNWGISVQPDAIRGIMKQARNNPAQESAALTRHLNIWMGADEALFSTRAWNACKSPTEITLEDYAGQDCEVAVDLASKVDLASVAIVFPSKDDQDRDIYTVFSHNFLNEAAILEGKNASYAGWERNGYLIQTEGNETDFATIEDHLRDLCKRFKVRSIAYDPWNATQLSQRLLAENVPMMEFKATTMNFSEPTKEFSAAIAAGRVIHDGNPVLTWAIGNVVGHFDARSNVYPRRARPEAKIDPAIAAIMAIARCMTATPEGMYIALI